ncbi:MAG: DUF302 domain-containing protein [Chloroflexota bacterium]
MTTQTTGSPRYGLGLHLEMPFTEAVERTRAALKEQGFGILTEIDVQKTLQEKLGAAFRPYLILGACNPPLAQRALEAEIGIGLLLPCNVVVYEEEGGGSRVEALDPRVALGVVGNRAIDPVAGEARARLQAALAALERGG